MVDDMTEEDFRSEMASQAREQRDAFAAMDQFEKRMKKNQPLGAANDDSSSEDEPSGPRRPISEVEIEKQKNQILMDKLFRS